MREPRVRRKLRAVVGVIRVLPCHDRVVDLLTDRRVGQHSDWQIREQDSQLPSCLVNAVVLTLDKAKIW